MTESLSKSTETGKSSVRYYGGQDPNVSNLKPIQKTKPNTGIPTIFETDSNGYLQQKHGGTKARRPLKSSLTKGFVTGTTSFNSNQSSKSKLKNPKGIEMRRLHKRIHFPLLFLMLGFFASSVIRWAYCQVTFWAVLMNWPNSTGNRQWITRRFCMAKNANNKVYDKIVMLRTLRCKVRVVWIYRCFCAAYRHQSLRQHSN